MTGQILDSKSEKPATPTGLAFKWREYMRKTHGRDVCITSANLGQFRHFVRVTGTDAEVIMNFALENWMDFVLDVLHSENPQSGPASPDIMFLVRNTTVLMKMLAIKDSGKGQLQKPAPSNSLMYKPVQEPKATNEEIQEIYEATLKKMQEIEQKKKNKPS